MPLSYRVLTPPAVEPITVEEAASYLRVDFPDDDGVIANLIAAARMYAENVMHRALATQTLRVIETITRPTGGEISGPISRGPNWYQYQEQLGANPFGAAMFYFDLPQPPIQSVSKIETRTTVWDPWVTFGGLVTLDEVPEPARLYFQVPVTANQWRFTYTCGYDPDTTKGSYALPQDIRQCLLELIAFWYDHREGDELPSGLMMKLLTHRVEWMGGGLWGG